jgi:ABC-type multidrug transport system fused ATPase/permease subunit
VFLTVAICISCRLDAGLAGLLILYSLNSAYILGWIMTTMIEAQAELIPFDRIAALDAKLEDESLATTRSILQIVPLKAWPITGTVHFNKLFLRYRPELPIVLNGLSLKIESGQKVALVGRTGSGKSSMIAALFRVVAPDSGHILIDGVDIAEIPLNILRHRISIVPQDPVLFAGTLRFNLDPEGIYTDDHIWRVLEETSMSKEVSSNPLKIDMVVEEGGSNFSVGQKQLLCLARALLRPTPILVIDEATANVDYETDARIQSVLREHVKNTGCTLVTVAHRISTVVDYDRIAVLGSGQLLEYGSPKELYEKADGVFREMANRASVTI